MARYHRPPKVKLWENRQSSFWWVRFYQDGKIRRESTGIPRNEKKRAKEYAAKRQEAALAEHYGFFTSPKRKVVTLKEVLDCYRRRLVPEYGMSKAHIQATLPSLRRWEEELGSDTPIAMVNTKAVEDALIRLTQKHKFSAGTRHHYITYLNSCFIQALGDKLIAEKPYTIKKPVVQEREINWTPDQVQKILESVDWKVAAHRVAAIALTTGLRLGDIKRLDWRDHIDLENQRLDIVTNKRKVRVNLPLHPLLLRWLKENRQLGGAVVPGMTRYISAKVAEFTQAACGTAFYPHDLRYLFANQAKDSMLRQKVLGHKNLVTTARYTRIQQSEIDEQVLSMYQFDGNKSTK